MCFFKQWNVVVFLFITTEAATTATETTNDHKTLLGFLYLLNYSLTREKQMKKTIENDKIKKKNNITKASQVFAPNNTICFFFLKKYSPFVYISWSLIFAQTRQKNIYDKLCIYSLSLCYRSPMFFFHFVCKIPITFCEFLVVKRNYFFENGLFISAP